jgi:hypothetical protein
MFNFIEYFRDIAEKLTDIQHTESQPRFHRVSGIASIEELMTNMGHTTGFQLLVEDNYNGRFANNLSENWLNYRLYTFYILKQAAVTNADELEDERAECMDIACKIIAKLKYDHLTDHRAQTNYGLRNLDNAGIRYQSVGPLGDHYYGILISFNLLEPAHLVYDPADYNITDG